MLGDLESSAEIARLTDRLLRQADAYGRFPTRSTTSSALRSSTSRSIRSCPTSSLPRRPAHPERWRHFGAR